MKFDELPLEDQIFMLQQELQQAANTVIFLHKCLTEPKSARYDYPQQTIDHLIHWEKILPENFGCGHSVTKMDCRSCQKNNAIRKRMKEIKDKLSTELQWFDAKMTSPRNNLAVIARLKSGEIVEIWQQFGEWPDGFEVVEWRFK